jgi:predicted dehydrogenase
LTDASNIDPVRVAVVGCGMISEVYLRNLTSFAKAIRVIACADKIPERAKAAATRFGVSRACTVEEVMADPSLELVVNLTIPRAHADVTLRAIEAGKAVYSEKPLGTSRDEGKRIVEAAKSKRMRVGCAPDTFLGGGFQTARKLLDDGWIGRPVAAVSFRADHGPDEHPDGAFFYEKGGGPLFDMGPYYLTELVNLLGPIDRVTGFTKISFEERTALSKAPWGRLVKVEVPTHVAGVLAFRDGTVCSLINSFDVWGANLPHIEVYGTTGSLQVPNPNRFGGYAKVRKMGSEEWLAVPPLGGFREDARAEDLRGIGVLDMAYAMRLGRAHRANVDVAYHVLDVMEGLYESSSSGRHFSLSSSCERPPPLPLDPAPGEIQPE